MGKLYVVDTNAVETGKTKDPYSRICALGEKNALFVGQFSDEKTFLAYRNLRECSVVDSKELNA